LGDQQQVPKSPVTLVAATDRYKLSQEKIDSILNGHQNIKDNAGRSINPQQLDAMIIHNKIPYPFSYFENALMSIRTLWKPIDITYNYTTGGYRFDGKWSLRHNIAVGLTYGILLPFMIIGLWKLFKTKKELAIFFIAIIVYHTIIHALFIPFTRFRYRVPIDFLVIMLGCYGIWLSYGYVKMKYFSKKAL
jgi:hypothetical protein